MERRTKTILPKKRDKSIHHRKHRGNLVFVFVFVLVGTEKRSDELVQISFVVCRVLLLLLLLFRRVRERVDIWKYLSVAVDTPPGTLPGTLYPLRFQLEHVLHVSKNSRAFAPHLELAAFQSNSTQLSIVNFCGGVEKVLSSSSSRCSFRHCNRSRSLFAFPHASLQRVVSSLLVFDCFSQRRRVPSPPRHARERAFQRVSRLLLFVFVVFFLDVRASSSSSRCRRRRRHRRHHLRAQRVSHPFLSSQQKLQSFSVFFLRVVWSSFRRHYTTSSSTTTTTTTRASTTSEVSTRAASRNTTSFFSSGNALVFSSLRARSRVLLLLEHERCSFSLGEDKKDITVFFFCSLSSFFDFLKKKNISQKCLVSRRIKVD